jgi:hypothetical protein
MAENGKLATVRALLDTADSYEAEGNSEASASYRAKAEQLMKKYRIDQEEALAINPTIAEPIAVELDLVGYGSQYKSQYAVMFWYIAKHCGVQHYCRYVYTEQGYTLRVHVVGYEEDVRYAEMLFTSARMVFTERLEPKVNPQFSDQVNAYRLRSAGIERVRIAEMMWGNTDKVFLGRVGRLYKAECAERGEEPMLSGRGVTGKAYREQYAEQFVNTLSGRLWQARQAAGEGGGLVMHGREERIREAFYRFYPDQRPKPALPTADKPECEKCAKSKRGACRDCYVPMGRSSNGPDYNSVAAERGRMAGATAARSVELNRGGGRAGIGG